MSYDKITPHMTWSEIAAAPATQAFWNSEFVRTFEDGAVRQLLTGKLSEIDFNRMQERVATIRSLREVAFREAKREAETAARTAEDTDETPPPRYTLPQVS